VKLTEGSVISKFFCETKRKNRNAVVEVAAGTRKTILHTKIKLGWQRCRVYDYVTATRCFNCSTYNHRTMNCRGETPCPLRAAPHTVKECKGAQRHISASTVRYITNITRPR
jgi:hypothetical protein